MNLWNATEKKEIHNMSILLKHNLSFNVDMLLVSFGLQTESRVVLTLSTSFFSFSLAAFLPSSVSRL